MRELFALLCVLSPLPSFAMRVNAPVEIRTAPATGGPQNAGTSYSPGVVSLSAFAVPSAAGFAAPASLAPAAAALAAEGALAAAPAAAQPMFARGVSAGLVTGDSQRSELSALAGDAASERGEGQKAPAPAESAGAQAPNELFDGAKTKLDKDETLTFVLAGYRFKDGRLISPADGAPVTAGHVREFRNNVNAGRARHALLLLLRESKPGDPRVARLIAENRAALPRELIEARERAALEPERLNAERLDRQHRRREAAGILGEQDPVKVGAYRWAESARDALERWKYDAELAGKRYRAIAQRRLTSLWRRALDKEFSAEAPAAVGGAEEEKLGRLVAEAAVKALSRTEEGRRQLALLREHESELPAVRVLKLDGRFGALYSANNKLLVIELGYLGEALANRLTDPKEESDAALKAANEAKRAELRAAFATEAGALEYLGARPEAVALMADAVDSSIHHELRHHLDNLSRPFSGAVARGQAPPMVTIEMEYAAIFTQNMHVLERLLAPDAEMTRIDRVQELATFLGDFDEWVASIDKYYRENFVHGYGDIKTVAAAHEDAARLAETLAAAGLQRDAANPAAGETLLALDAGSAAIDAELKAVAPQLDEYRKKWEEVSSKGLERWAELSSRQDNPMGASWALRLLAKKSKDEAQAKALLARADAELERARQALAAGAQPLLTRIQVIAQLIEHYQKEGRPWGDEVWTGVFRDYPQYAALAREKARGADAATKQFWLAKANEFDDAVAYRRKQLARTAWGNLHAAYADPKEEVRARGLALGRAQAKMLGDAELTAELERAPRDGALPADAARAGYRERLRASALKDMERGASEGLERLELAYQKARALEDGELASSVQKAGLEAQRRKAGEARAKALAARKAALETPEYEAALAAKAEARKAEKEAAQKKDAPEARELRRNAMRLRQAALAAARAAAATPLGRAFHEAERAAQKEETEAKRFAESIRRGELQREQAAKVSVDGLESSPVRPAKKSLLDRLLRR